MYEIKQTEPEGWEKAFTLFFAGKKITHFRFLDTAEDYLKELIN